MAPQAQGNVMLEGSDTETGAEQAAMIDAPAPAAGKLGRRGALSMLVTGVALVAAGVTTYKARLSSHKPVQSGARMVSMSTAPLTVHKNTGCSNWATIMLEPEHPSIEKTEAACEMRCRQTPSCGGYNYQKQDNCDEVQGGMVAARERGACYLLSAKVNCTQMSNTCWDLAILKTEVPAAWHLVKEQTGCKNWESITSHKLMVSNPDACGKRCLETRGCERFNMRTKNIQDSNCYLMSGTCEHQVDDEWDFYRMNMVAPSGPTPWSLVGPNIGCLNWAEIKIGSVSVEYDPKLCGARCKAMGSECKAFGWQKEDGGSPQANGKHDHEGFKTSACYIFGGDCDQTYNDLWDLYAMNTPTPTASPQAPAPAPTASPTPAPTHSNDAPAVFCPAVKDLHSIGAGVTLQDQGWTITGEGDAATSNTYNLMPNGKQGWLAYTVDISGVQTGMDTGKFITTSTFVSFPSTGQGAYKMDDPAQVCSSAPHYEDGGSAKRFCAEMQTLETNGHDAYGVSWRLSPANDVGSAKCRSHLAIDKPPRGTCRAERFFDGSACTSATNQKIDSTKPFDVWALFDKTIGMTVYLKQGNETEKIDAGVLSMGGSETPDSVTIMNVAFAMKSYGAAIESKLFNAGWAPASLPPFDGHCPESPASLAASTMKVSNLRMYAINHRGPQPTECADQTEPPEIAEFTR
jgi:hypothetical protein